MVHILWFGSKFFSDFEFAVFAVNPAGGTGSDVALVPV
jgi:hypothetical protein